MYRDYYREWSYQDRCDARDRGECEAVSQWDRDYESSERAYQNWRNGGDFQDNVPDERFS
jgi:hypothetical protein